MPERWNSGRWLHGVDRSAPVNMAAGRGAPPCSRPANAASENRQSIQEPAHNVRGEAGPTARRPPAGRMICNTPGSGRAALPLGLASTEGLGAH